MNKSEFSYNRNRGIIHHFIVLWLVLFMVNTTPVLTRWMNNNFFVSVQDFLLPLIISIITSFLIALLFIRMYLLNKFAGLVGALLAVILIGQDFDIRISQAYPFIEAFNLLKGFGLLEKVFSCFVFIIIIIGGAYFVSMSINKYTNKKKWKIDILANGVMIVIVTTFMIQFYSVTKDLYTGWPQFFYRPPALLAKLKIDASLGKPDIYYIVFDRYTNENVLKDQFGFDNSDFINYLKENNFSVNPNAYANYPSTTLSIASTLNANYLNDITSKFSHISYQTFQPSYNNIRYSPVIKKLKNLDYKYYHLGSGHEASNKAPFADYIPFSDGQLTIFGKEIILDNFPKSELSRSLYNKIAKFDLKIGGFSLLTYNSQSEYDATLSKFRILNKLTSEPSGGRFIFAHILSPHHPFNFNSDGSLSEHPNNDNLGQSIKKKYINQVEFVNSQIIEIVNKIQKESQGKAIIIIQADEGPYPELINSTTTDSISLNNNTLYIDMEKRSKEDYQMKYGVLAAYHIPAATKEDIAMGGDNVNIFRLIFNTYFGGNMPYLPECYYSGQMNKPFVFNNINEIINGKPNSDCPNDGDFTKGKK